MAVPMAIHTIIAGLVGVCHMAWASDMAMLVMARDTTDILRP